MHNLPHHQVAVKVYEDTNAINSRFSMMDNQFEQYQKDVSEYKNYLTELLKTRHDQREQGHEGNQGNQEQKEILNSVIQVQAVIAQYEKLMDSNHLVKQIEEYDKSVKDYDKHFVDQDENILKTLTSKNANDDYLDNEELKHLFSQQVRKIMSKHVKENEKVIKQNTALGIMGAQSKVVDYIMYMSICFVLYFGYIAFKKLQEQKDSLVIWRMRRMDKIGYKFKCYFKDD